MPVIIQPDPAVPISDGRFPHGEVIVVVNRAASGRKDAGGNDIEVETSQSYIGAFAPAIGFESTGLKDQVSTQPQVFLPFAAVVTPTSVVIARGDRYEVDGVPAYWSNPHSGDQPGVQVPLKRVSG